jgi:hypothetical protein
MADSSRLWDMTDKSFTLFDATKNKLGIFTGFSGGGMSISMIPYTVVSATGSVTEKYIPGQISFAPITLSCAFSDIVPELTEWFELSAAGDYDGALLRNCSIASYPVNDPKKYNIIWNLINVIPTTLPSFFNYNVYTGSSSTKFKLVLQAEEIYIEYPKD